MWPLLPFSLSSAHWCSARSSKEGIFLSVQTAPEISRYFSLNTSSCIGFSSRHCKPCFCRGNFFFSCWDSIFLECFSCTQNQEELEPNKSLQHMKKIVETTLMYSLLYSNSTPFFNLFSDLSSVCTLFWIGKYLMFFKRQLTYTVFENHPKCRIWFFEFWHFPPIFVVLK